MTPEEILHKQFGTALRGYKQDEVSAYLEEVSGELKKARRERDDFQKKLEILAEKLEEYRGDEESLRAALIGAQKLGDNVVREARKKAEEILTEASQKADSLINDSKRSMDAEAYTLSKLKLEVSKFKAQILSLYKKQIELINTIPSYEEAKKSLPVPAEAIEVEALQPDPSQEADGLKLEYEQVPDGESEVGAQRGSRFGALRFGDDFKLERND